MYQSFAFPMIATLIIAFSVTPTHAQIAEPQTINRGFEVGATAWEQWTTGGSIVSDSSSGNKFLRLVGNGGWGQYVFFNGLSKNHLLTLKGLRRPLEGFPSWSGFGITYYDARWNEVGFFERPIFWLGGVGFDNVARDHSLGVKIPENAVQAHIWCWNTSDSTETLIDDFVLSNFYPEDGYVFDPNAQAGNHYRWIEPFDRNLILNGEFQSQVTSAEGTEIVMTGDDFWFVRNPYNNSVEYDRTNGWLSVGNYHEDSAVAQEIFGFEQDASYEFSVDAYRQQVFGQFTSKDLQYATVGLDFFDADWTPIGQTQISIPGPTSSTENGGRAVTVTVPENTEHMFAWIWVQRAVNDVYTKLNVRRIELRAIEP